MRWSLNIFGTDHEEDIVITNGWNEPPKNILKKFDETTDCLAAYQYLCRKMFAPVDFWGTAGRHIALANNIRNELTSVDGFDATQLQSALLSEFNEFEHKYKGQTFTIHNACLSVNIDHGPILVWCEEGTQKPPDIVLDVYDTSLAQLVFKQVFIYVMGQTQALEREGIQEHIDNVVRICRPIFDGYFANGPDISTIENKWKSALKKMIRATHECIQHRWLLTIARFGPKDLRWVVQQAWRFYEKNFCGDLSLSFNSEIRLALAHAFCKLSAGESNEQNLERKRLDFICVFLENLCMPDFSFCLYPAVDSIFRQASHAQLIVARSDNVSFRYEDENGIPNFEINSDASGVRCFCMASTFSTSGTRSTRQEKMKRLSECVTDRIQNRWSDALSPKTLIAEILVDSFSTIFSDQQELQTQTCVDVVMVVQRTDDENFQPSMEIIAAGVGNQEIFVQGKRKRETLLQKQSPTHNFIGSSKREINYSSREMTSDDLFIALGNDFFCDNVAKQDQTLRDEFNSKFKKLIVSSYADWCKRKPSQSLQNYCEHRYRLMSEFGREILQSYKQKIDTLNARDETVSGAIIILPVRGKSLNRPENVLQIAPEIIEVPDLDDENSQPPHSSSNDSKIDKEHPDAANGDHRPKTQERIALENEIQKYIGENFPDQQDILYEIVLSTLIDDGKEAWKLYNFHLKDWEDILFRHCVRTLQIVAFETKMSQYGTGKMFEMLQKTELSSAQQGKPLGAWNRSCFCYLNSFLQAVSCIPVTQKICHKFSERLSHMSKEEPLELVVSKQLATWFKADGSDWVACTENDSSPKFKTAFLESVDDLSYNESDLGAIGAFLPIAQGNSPPTDPTERVRKKFAKGSSDREMMLQHFALMSMITACCNCDQDNGSKTVDEDFNLTCQIENKTGNLEPLEGVEGQKYSKTFQVYRELIASVMDSNRLHFDNTKIGEQCIFEAKVDKNLEVTNIFSAIFSQPPFLHSIMNEELDLEKVDWGGDHITSMSVFFDLFRSLFLIIRPEQQVPCKGTNIVPGCQHNLPFVHFPENTEQTLFSSKLVQSPYYLTLRNQEPRVFDDGEVFAYDLKELIEQALRTGTGEPRRIQRTNGDGSDSALLFWNYNGSSNLSGDQACKDVKYGLSYDIPVNAPEVLCIEKSIFYQIPNENKKRDFQIIADWENFKPFDLDFITSESVRNSTYSLCSFIIRHGENNNKGGHFECCVRRGTDQYYRINDSAVKKKTKEYFFELATKSSDMPDADTWTEGGEVYMYFFEKKH